MKPFIKKLTDAILVFSPVILFMMLYGYLLGSGTWAKSGKGGIEKNKTTTRQTGDFGTEAFLLLK